LPRQRLPGTQTTDGEVGLLGRFRADQVAKVNTRRGFLEFPPAHFAFPSDLSHPARHGLYRAGDGSFAGYTEPVTGQRQSFPDSPSAKVLIVMNVQAIADATFAPAEHLEMQLQQRLGSRVRELRVLVRHDGVVLKGWASTYHAKQLAQHAAMELADKRVLANDIEVR